MYIEPHIVIGREDDQPINEEELIEFIERFCRWLESEGYECGGSWKLVDNSTEIA